MHLVFSTLSDDLPFETVLRLYIVSSGGYGDFRKMHAIAENRLSEIVQKHPLDLDFAQLDLVGMAFNNSKNSGNSQVIITIYCLPPATQRAIYSSRNYSNVHCTTLTQLTTISRQK